MMIRKIEMIISNFNVLIDKENNNCIINDRECVLKSDDIDNIIRIIRNWDYNYINNKIIGENHNMINIICNDNEYKYRFDNAFPDNFRDLVDYIGGIYDR